MRSLIATKLSHPGKEFVKTITYLDFWRAGGHQAKWLFKYSIESSSLFKLDYDTIFANCPIGLSSLCSSEFIHDYFFCILQGGCRQIDDVRRGRSAPCPARRAGTHHRSRSEPHARTLGPQGVFLTGQPPAASDTAGAGAEVAALTSEMESIVKEAQAKTPLRAAAV